MSGSSDDLVRLEYKLDLIIRALQHNDLMLDSRMIPPLEGISEDSCPVCSGSIRLEVDFDKETTTYSCLCQLPVSAVDGISALRQSPEPSKENNDANRRNDANPEVSRVEATRSNSDR